MSKYNSNQYLIDRCSIDKRRLWLAVNKQIKHSVYSTHTLTIINLLLEELITSIFNQQEINIGNFGVFFVQKMKDKKHHDFQSKTIKYAKGNSYIRFKLNKKLAKYLIDNLIVIPKETNGKD